MTIIGEEFKNVHHHHQKKVVVVGIRIDSQSRELISWALVKVADPGDHVFAVRVCRKSDNAIKEKPLLDEYLEVYKGLCNANKVSKSYHFSHYVQGICKDSSDFWVDLTGEIFIGNSIKKVLVREAKKSEAIAVVVGIKVLFRGWASPAKYCAKQLPPNVEVLAIHNGKIVFRRCNNNQLPGLKGDPRPSFYLIGTPTLREIQSEFEDSEEASEHKKSCGDFKDENFSFSPLFSQKRTCFSSLSLPIEDTLQETPGWPLLRRTSSLTPKAEEARKMSVVQWAMSLPNRSPPETPQNKDGIYSNPKKNQFSSDMSDFSGQSPHSFLYDSVELQKDLELQIKRNSSGCTWLSHKVLESSTSQFSTENMVGKGGCSRVYKAQLPDGKLVAVKFLKSSKEAWKDFILEVDIISSLKHEHIIPLLGVCVENNDLITVYDFLSRGSLEETLHGTTKGKSVLPWEVRFNVALGVADALNYLHNECSPPVIHRDVKSSNILLTNNFKSQLSDFGLAIWGPTTSSFQINCDVVGTFGYLAPEYFMCGKVSDKIDVYSYGVVLLELISGRKPIGSEDLKGQESLVMWAKPKLESGDIQGMVDPTLDGKFDEAQMKRMVLAATFCITQRAHFRPKMSKILELLRGEMEIDKWETFQSKNQEVSEDQDEEIYLDSKPVSHLNLALLEVDDDCTSFGSAEQRNNISLEEYLRGRWSISSSSD
ncbi:LOW QUALITY PROTEIN: Protein kinase domain [Dillenia turbinata]|uniref:Protein kinase domain n=1 Tax=Dillenia turbinata TaxID=194707 RepID=A0AAN8WAY5_9MAGN